MAMNKKNVSDSDTMNNVMEDINAAVEPTEAAPIETTPAAPTAKGRYDGITNFAYVGPSLPGGGLKSLSTLNGTYAKIADYYKDVIEQFPNVARLIVPVAVLAESREKIEKGGNLLHKHYQELAAAIMAKGVEQ